MICADHVLRDCGAQTTVCLVCGITTTTARSAVEQRARDAALLAHWGEHLAAWWPGIPQTHKALLTHLSEVFGAELTEETR